MRERQAAQLAAAFILKARRPVGLVRLLRAVRGAAVGDSGQETTSAHDFIDHLLSIPCVGEDDDFRRDAFPPREVDLGL